jgi:hypothetical protein
MELKNRITAGKLLCFAYIGILFAFALGRLVMISNARDPYFMGYAVPTQGWFQISAGLIALATGIASLLAIGFAIERGSAKQTLYALFTLPLILFLLEAITLDY